MRALLLALLILSACAAPATHRTSGLPQAVYHAVKIGADDEGFGDGSDRAVLPASTVKLITAAAVLETAPPTARFRTSPNPSSPAPIFTA